MNRNLRKALPSSSSSTSPSASGFALILMHLRHSRHFRHFFPALAFLTLLSLPSCIPEKKGGSEKPNDLFIMCDDLNDWVEGMGGNPQAITPNIKQLAEEGILFTNAHSNDPICAPSRASLFKGIYPHSSGLYSFERWMMNPTLQNCKTLMEHFLDYWIRYLKPTVKENE